MTTVVEPSVLTDMRWLNSLQKAESVAGLRKTTQQRYPELDPYKLTRIAIVGTADEGLRLVEICQKRNVQVAALCDDNPGKQGKSIAGTVVQPLDQLQDVNKSIPVIIASHRVLKPVNRIKAMGFKTVAPIAALEVLAPDVVPPHMFYDGWLEDLFNNRAQYTKLAEMLADDRSREVLDAVIGFRLTADPTELSDVVEWDLYGADTLLNYSNNEVYIDGGTFDGDTIRLFIDRVKGKFDRVIGFEPDTGTFKKLVANFSDEPRVEALNKGLYSHTDTLYFDNAGTRGSILTDEASKGIAVPVTSIDDVLQGDRVTFIKMNIEGAEIPALHGAKNAIKQWTPKLAISAYHRPSDLWQIPFLVKQLNNNYDLYLRQHDGGVIETVLYGIKR